MNWLTGVVWAASLLLIVTGAVKCVLPGSTGSALLSLGWRHRPLAVARGIGAAEVITGTAALLVAGPAATTALALFYAAFTVVLVRWLRSADPPASCGCAGSQAAPPTWSHVVVTATFGLAAVLSVALGDSQGIAATAAGSAADYVVVGDAILVAGLGWLVIAVLPSVDVAVIRRMRERG
jgi:hypothetical protein